MQKQLDENLFDLRIICCCDPFNEAMDPHFSVIFLDKIYELRYIGVQVYLDFS